MRSSGPLACVLLGLAACAACRSHGAHGQGASREPASASASTTSSPTPRASAPSASPLTSAASQGRAGDLDAAVVVVVSRSSMLVDGELVATLPATREAAAHAGMDAALKSGASGRYVVPLGDAVKRSHERAWREAGAVSKQAVVILDPGTPYRVLAEVLFTLGEVGVTKFQLMVLQPKGVADAGPAVPAPAIARAPLDPPLAMPRRTPLLLRVELTEDGASFRTADAVLGPRCDRVSRGLTVPKLAGKQDEQGIRLCARHLKDQAPEESSVAIGATEAVDFGSVLAAMDGLRKDEQGEIFPEVTFLPLP